MGLPRALTNSQAARLALAVTGLVASVLVLRTWPPGTVSFYPPCPIHQFTGLLCPGCGSTRALGALAQGHVAIAFEANALTTLLLPAAILWGAYSLWQSARGRSLPLTPPRPAIYSLLAVAVLFTIVRNLHPLSGA